jgi:hypothetical protein
MTKEKILKALERVKWFLWHGNVFRADETLTDLMFDVDGAIEEDREARRPAHLVLKKLGQSWPKDSLSRYAVFRRLLAASSNFRFLRAVPVRFCGCDRRVYFCPLIK